MRLGYLHPELEFSVSNGGIKVVWQSISHPPDLARLREDSLHNLYRERIYSETLSIRKWLNSDE